MKESGNVLLPPWYPIEPLLEDNEKVVLSYGCEILEYDASHGNETSFLCGPNTESIRYVLLYILTMEKEFKWVSHMFLGFRPQFMLFLAFRVDFSNFRFEFAVSF